MCCFRFCWFSVISDFYRIEIIVRMFSGSV